MSSAENRKKRTCERAQVIQGRMGENEIWLNRVEEQIKEASKMDSIPQVRYLIECSIAKQQLIFQAQGYEPMIIFLDIYPFSMGIVFIHQNLTSNVRI